MIRDRDPSGPLGFRTGLAILGAALAAPLRWSWFTVVRPSVLWCVRPIEVLFEAASRVLDGWCWLAHDFARHAANQHAGEAGEWLYEIREGARLAFPNHAPQREAFVQYCMRSDTRISYSYRFHLAMCSLWESLATVIKPARPRAGRHCDMDDCRICGERPASTTR